MDSPLGIVSWFGSEVRLVSLRTLLVSTAGCVGGDGTEGGVDTEGGVEGTESAGNFAATLRVPSLGPASPVPPEPSRGSVRLNLSALCIDGHSENLLKSLALLANLLEYSVSVVHTQLKNNRTKPQWTNIVLQGALYVWRNLSL